MRSAKSRSASTSSTGFTSTPCSAVDTLLFPLHHLPHGERGIGVLAGDFAEGRAGELFLVERGERLAETKQRVGGLGARLEFLRQRQEGVGCTAIVLALEHALAEPVLRLGREAVARIAPHEVAEGILGEGVVLVQEIAVAEIVDVARRL